MPRVLFKGAVLADSELCHIVEGNYYFPHHAVDHRYLHPSDTHTVCGWKGVASYYHVDVDGEVNIDAACVLSRSFIRRQAHQGLHSLLERCKRRTIEVWNTSRYLKFEFQRRDDGSIRCC